MNRYDLKLRGDVYVMESNDRGRYVLHHDVVRLQRQMTDVSAELDDWKRLYASQQNVYQDIGHALGANTPAELVNEVARRRMAELAEVTAERDLLLEQLKLADALRNRERGMEK